MAPDTTTRMLDGCRCAEARRARQPVLQRLPGRQGDRPRGAASLPLDPALPEPEVQGQSRAARASGARAFVPSAYRRSTRRSSRRSSSTRTPSAGVTTGSRSLTPISASSTSKRPCRPVALACRSGVRASRASTLVEAVRTFACSSSRAGTPGFVATGSLDSICTATPLQTSCYDYDGSVSGGISFIHSYNAGGGTPSATNPIARDVKLMGGCGVGVTSPARNRTRTSTSTTATLCRDRDRRHDRLRHSRSAQTRRPGCLGRCVR